MFTTNLVGRWIDRVDCCPWGALAGRAVLPPVEIETPRPGALYTREQRRRRDASRWTLVQGILAPTQFLVFLISLGFVLHYLASGRGYTGASASVVVKTVVLLTIMTTGSLWERDVFGKYLFAPVFFWEDVFSVLVIALHLSYVAALLSGTVSPRAQMLIALAAYAAYVVNATQFVLKLRAARLETEPAGEIAGVNRSR